MEKRLQNRLFGCIRQVVSTLELRTETDQELLQRFVGQRDEAAFAAVVRRHGPMVLRVAFRTVQNEHDAEDVFQATFLVLSQKAHTLRRQESLGSWLYGIAYRLALKAKATAGERWNRERRVPATPAATPLAQITVQEAQTILDEELNRLPKKFREPVVLCCLEGLARDEAAQQIGCPASVLKSRLEQARERLRQRLIARGLTLPCGFGAFLLLEEAAAATVPPALIGSTTKAAITIAAGKAARTVVTAKVVALTEGIVKTMFLTKLTIVGALLTAVAAVGVTMAVGPLSPQADKPANNEREVATGKGSEQSPKDKESKSDKELAGLDGRWDLVSEEHDGKKSKLMFESYQFAFKGKKVTTTWARDDGSTGGGTNSFVIDSTKNPKELTITGDNIKIQAVYKLEKDQLTLALFGKPEEARPKGFTAADAAGEGRILVVQVLKRADQAKENAKATFSMRVRIEKVNADSRSIDGMLPVIGEFDGVTKPLRFEHLSVSENATLKHDGKDLKFANLKPDTGVLLELEAASETALKVVGIETGKTKPSQGVKHKRFSMRVHIENVDASPRSITASCMILGQIDNVFKPLRFEHLSVSENAKIKHNGKDLKFTDLKPGTGVFLELDALSELALVVVGIETLGKAKPGVDPVPKVEDDKKTLQGIWKGEIVELAGRPLVEKVELHVDGDQLTLRGPYWGTGLSVGPPVDNQFTFKVKSSKPLGEIDMTRKPDAEDNASKVVLGVYAVKGDTLRVCLGLENKVRPKALKTSADSRSEVMLVLKRAFGAKWGELPKVDVVPVPVEPKAAPEKKDGVPMEPTLPDAIKAFNEKASKDPIGKDETPITEQEVIAGIRASQRPKESDVTDKLYNAFKQIAETRQLPPGAALEALGGPWDPGGSFVYDVWFVRIEMPKEGGGTYSFKIRGRIIRSRTLHEELVRVEKALQDLPEQARQIPGGGRLEERVNDLKARIAKMKTK